MANNDTTAGSITGNSQSVVVDTISCANAYVIMSGTHAGITVNFEGTADGGATWFSLIGVDAGSASPSLVISVALTSNSSSQYQITVGAAKQMRIRSSAYTSGTLSLSIMPTSAGA